MDPAWITAITAVAVAVAALGVWAARWALRVLIGTHEFLADWPKMKADIAGLKSQVAAVIAETQPNGGHSLRDVVHRTAGDVADIKEEQGRLRALVEHRTPPPPRSRKPPS